MLKNAEVRAILEKWWNTEIANSPISRSTEMHNKLLEAFQRLHGQFQDKTEPDADE